MLPGPDERVEVLTARMLVRGTLVLESFNRVSDCINLQHGLLTLKDVEFVSPRSQALAGPIPELLIHRDRIHVVGQREAPGHTGKPSERIPKVRCAVVVILLDFVAAGIVFLPLEGSLDVFLDSRDPPFVPMSSVELAAASGELVARYAFALVNREAIVAARAVDSEPNDEAPPAHWGARSH